MSRERWRKVQHMPHVEVSDQGRARSSYAGPGVTSADEPRILAVDSKGRISGGHQAKVSLAVLVLEAYVGPRPDRAVALRLDGDPHNNALSNLRWATTSELAAHRNPRGERHPNAGKRLTARGWR